MSKNPPNETTSERELSEAIEETLNDLFGENVSKIIFFNVGKSSSAKDPENFFKNIESLLDFDNGSDLVKRHVLERLYTKKGLTFEEKQGYSFNDYLTEFKNKQKKGTTTNCLKTDIKR
jgi:hypothetical protein